MLYLIFNSTIYMKNFNKNLIQFTVKFEIKTTQVNRYFCFFKGLTINFTSI